MTPGQMTCWLPTVRQTELLAEMSRLNVLPRLCKLPYILAALMLSHLFVEATGFL